MELWAVRKTVIFIAVILLLLGGTTADLFADYPADPLTDLSWSSGTSGVADIKSAFDKSITVILSGGWDDDYSSNGNGLSVIGGPLTITAGTVIVDKIVIQEGTTLLAQTELLSCGGG